MSLNAIESSIIRAMARAMFVTAWADFQERYGDGYAPGTELMDAAPETPAYVLQEAHVWAGIIVGMNLPKGSNIPQRSMFFLFREALKADGKDPDVAQDDLKLQAHFGHSLAMEIMGSGVSWADDHAELPFGLPYIGWSCMDLDDAGYPIPGEDLFTPEEYQQIEQEGWGIFNDPPEIQRLDEMDEGPRFPTDEHALDHVRKRASEGSTLHQKALRACGVKESAHG